MNTKLEREHPLPDKAMFNRTRPSGFAKMGADDVEMIIDCTEFFVEMGDEPFLQKLLWYAQRMPTMRAPPCPSLLCPQRRAPIAGALPL